MELELEVAFELPRQTIGARFELAAGDRARRTQLPRETLRPANSGRLTRLVLGRRRCLLAWAPRHFDSGDVDARCRAALAQISFPTDVAVEADGGFVLFP